MKPEKITRTTDYFDLHRICESGQIFRMYDRGDGFFDVFSANRHLRLRQQGKTVDFYCSQDAFETYWRRFFDLDRDYGAIVRAAASGDEYVERACRFGAGIRILHQDIWEMMISFIISQQKQIPSIRKCIEALCERFGERMREPVPGPENGMNMDAGEYFEWYAFPTPQSIAAGGPDGLKGLSLGYRERYIYETAVKYLTDGLPDEILENMGLDEAKAWFASYCGIGEKVANCICLFGAGYVDAFPIDTHIKDILYREYYLKNQGSAKGSRDHGLSQSDYEKLVSVYFDRFRGYRGIVQQWIFAWEIAKHKE